MRFQGEEDVLGVGFGERGQELLARLGPHPQVDVPADLKEAAVLHLRFLHVYFLKFQVVEKRRVSFQVFILAGRFDAGQVETEARVGELLAALEVVLVEYGDVDEIQRLLNDERVLDIRVLDLGRVDRASQVALAGGLGQREERQPILVEFLEAYSF